METWFENGNKMVSYTSEELRAKQARGETLTDWSKVKAKTDEEVEAAIANDPDATHPTDEELERMQAKWGGRHQGSDYPKKSTKPDKKIPVSVFLSPLG